MANTVLAGDYSGLISFKGDKKGRGDDHSAFGTFLRFVSEKNTHFQLK